MTKIILIRHVETIGNIEERLTGREDYELTRKGKETVEKLTQFLMNESIQSIYSSTSQRAYKTVEKLAQFKKIEIQQKEDLCEMYFGIYDGWKWKDVNKVNPLIHQKHIETNEIMCIPKQETTKQVETRIYNTILKIANENLGKTILICSHGVAIEAFLRKITGEKFIVKVKDYSQHNGSINIVNYDSDKNNFELKILNDIKYLKRKGKNDNEK